VGYVGVGISPAFLWLKNDSFCLGKKIYRRMVCGGVGKLGRLLFFSSHSLSDLFVDYLYEPIHFQHWSIWEDSKQAAD